MWVVMMCQCRLINGKKCTILMGDADNGGGYACVWAGGLWEISEPSSPFCCEPKIAQKTKSIGTSLVVQWLRL